MLGQKEGRRGKYDQAREWDALLRTSILRITDDRRITLTRMSILSCQIQPAARRSTVPHNHCRTEVGI
jgi:hypothetical protein